MKIDKTKNDKILINQQIKSRNVSFGLFLAWLRVILFVVKLSFLVSTDIWIQDHDDKK